MKKHKLITLFNTSGQSENFYIFVCFFIGVMLILLGEKIENFFLNMVFLQRLGVVIILFTTAILTLFSRISSVMRKIVILITLFISSVLILLDLDLFIEFSKSLSFLIFVIVLLASANILAFLTSTIKEINKKIENPAERLTILIGFFGVLISLLTLF